MGGSVKHTIIIIADVSQAQSGNWIWATLDLARTYIQGYKRGRGTTGSLGAHKTVVGYYCPFMLLLLAPTGLTKQ
jgi:hypothetical protein